MGVWVQVCMLCRARLPEMTEKKAGPLRLGVQCRACRRRMVREGRAVRERVNVRWNDEKEEDGK